MQRIVIASSNPGKLREFRHLLAPLGWDVVSQAELNVSSADEPHATFLENALAKARHAAAATGLPALADDSGICAAALNGAPGVLSARFAGEPSDDRRNNEELLRRLAVSGDRRAHYTCVLAAVRSADDPEPLIADARWHGEVLLQLRGSGGFGYDPLFLLPELGRTAAELEPAEKNRISHRGQAMAELARKMATNWI
ncbi:MAG: RdgB/HAM1 family non-canonical purine NTP pyrophosphatase [Burkholderiaceae bacterium]